MPFMVQFNWQGIGPELTTFKYRLVSLALRSKLPHAKMGGDLLWSKPTQVFDKDKGVPVTFIFARRLAGGRPFTIATNSSRYTPGMSLQETTSTVTDPHGGRAPTLGVMINAAPRPMRNIDWSVFCCVLSSVYARPFLERYCCVFSCLSPNKKERFANDAELRLVRLVRRFRLVRACVRRSARS